MTHAAPLSLALPEFAARATKRLTRAAALAGYRLGAGGVSRLCRRRTRRWLEKGGDPASRLQQLFGDFSSFAGSLDDGERRAVAARAEAALAGRFDILGSGPVELQPLDWHLDFKSGTRWPERAFYRDLRGGRPGADVKVPWELSRCHHFLALGQAWLLSGDERFGAAFAAQAEDWIRANPPLRGVNWACTMEVAIRAVNWCWALAMLWDCPALSPAVREGVLASLYAHGHFIFRNPEGGSGDNHNHYVADLVGQVTLGLLFSGAPEAARWLERGQRELFREMRLQVLPSGADYERSVSYHRLVLELFLSAVVLLERGGRRIPADIRFRLEKMCEFVQAYSKPDGRAPVIGDQDDGRLTPFTAAENLDHRSLLAVGAVLFHRADFKANASGYTADCFFLGGAGSRARFDALAATPSAPGSQAFPDAGFYIMRHGRDYLFVNAGGRGRYESGSGTHTHSDLLSFELYAGDKTFLVDPGTYVYSADPDARLLFRSTRMHNTLVVDGRDQNELRRNDLWNFPGGAEAEVTRWETDPAQDRFAARHNGYRRLDPPVVHERAIRFDKAGRRWQIDDAVRGGGEHRLEWFFHFAPGIELEIGPGGVTTRCPGTRLSLAFSAAFPLQLEVEEGWVSRAYGARERAPVLRVEARAACPATLRTVIRAEAGP